MSGRVSDLCPDCGGSWDDRMGDECRRPWYHYSEWMKPVEEDGA